GRDDYVYVVDAASDSIVTRMDYRQLEPYTLSWVPQGDKFYFADRGGIYRLGQADTIVDWMRQGGIYDDHAYSPDLDRLYWGSGGRLHVHDCGIDSIVSTTELKSPRSRGLLLSDLDKLYLAGDESTAVYDIRSDSILSWYGGWGLWQSYNSGNGKIYGWEDVNRNLEGIVVVDPRADSVVTVVEPSTRARALAVNSEVNKVYFTAHPETDVIYELDGVNHSVEEWVQLPERVWQLVMVDDVQKLYCYRGGVVYVVDCPTGNVVAEIPTAIVDPLGHKHAYNQQTKHLWFADLWRVGVIDCAADTLLAEFVELGRRRIHDVTLRGDRVYAGMQPNLIRVFHDAQPGVFELPGEAQPGRFGASVVRGMLPLPGKQGAALIDIAGRRVMELRPGANDIRHVVPGVYFVREVGPMVQGSEGSAKEPARSASSVRKVVIQR
ncbi:MAG: hypothetical protein JSU73_10195, partial [candidate division WOR-3 bacterium]